MCMDTHEVQAVVVEAFAPQLPSHDPPQETETRTDQRNSQGQKTAAEDWAE